MVLPNSSLSSFSTLIRRMSCIIILLFVGVCSQSTASSSWSKLHISHGVLVSMPYGNYRVNIYEDNNKSQNVFYYSPIAQLDYISAISVLNDVTNQNEMRFRIEMWNDKVENQVAKYLTDLFGRQIQMNQVQVVPFEKVALTSTTTSTTPTLYTPSADWLPYQQSTWFSLQCLLQKDCNQLAADMHTDPDQFDHLKLVYSPASSQSSQTFGAPLLNDIHRIQDSTPTAADWTQLIAIDSDLRQELNEMKLTIGILRKELNELKGNLNGSRNQNHSAEIPRRSSEFSSKLLSDTKVILRNLKNELTATSQKLADTKSSLTKSLNETQNNVENLRKELAEIKNRSIETSRRMAQEIRAELLSSKELKDDYQSTVTDKPLTLNCKGKPDGNYGDPSSDCSTRFYICAHGIAFHKNCPTGTVYRVETFQCDWSYNVPGCESI